MTTLASALEYASRGWRVTPYHSINDDNSCTCGKSKCERPGKHPKFNRYITEATTEPDRIHMWFGLSERANPAIVVGKRSGIVILDIESEKGHGVDGLKTLKEEHPPLFATRAERTPTDGGHLYFQHPGDELLENLSSQELGPGLELRAESVGVVAAPSVTPDGSYTITKDLPLAPLPDWLLEKSRDKRAERDKVRNAPPFEPSPTLTDEEVWDKALNAANSPKLRQLCAGDWQTLYESWSHADAGLIGILAFYTQDPEQLERLWQSTDLWRGKKSGKSAVYADCTIIHALSKTTETYKAPDDSAKFLLNGHNENTSNLETTATPIPTLPEEFWESREILRIIRQAAHSRGRSADAVLGCLLARMSAGIPHRLKIPPIVGSHAPLNLMVALVGPPGSGKGSAHQIAVDLLELDLERVIGPLPLGSGEGFAESFFDMQETVAANGKKIKQKVRAYWNASFYADEGEVLSTLGSRQGSTLLSSLRTAFSGGLLGQSNATQDRRRIVPSGDYSMGLVLGLQPELSGPLLDDSAAGTPQRFLWFSSIDPTVPDDLPEWPENASIISAGIRTIDYLYQPNNAVRHLQIPDSITREIRKSDLDRVRGRKVQDPMQAHHDLVQLKVASCLAIFEQRQHIEDEDWDLAASAKKVSDLVRAHAQKCVMEIAKEKEIEASAKVARREIKVGDFRTEEAAKRIRDRVKSQPGMSPSELNQTLRKWRDVYGDALNYAINQGWVHVREAPGRGTEKRMLYPGKPKG